MRKFKYVVGNGLEEDRSAIILIPDRVLAGMTEEEVNAYVEKDFQSWLKHNATIYWEKVEGGSK